MTFRGKGAKFTSRHPGAANAPPPPPSTVVTPRPAARGPGNWPPTPTGGSSCRASASLAPPRQAPPGPAPAARLGVRASSSRPHPQPRGAPPAARSAGLPGLLWPRRFEPRRRRLRPSASRAAGGGAAQREGACLTPATGRRWRRQATGAAWPRARCCSAPRGRRHSAGKGAPGGRADTSC